MPKSPARVLASFLLLALTAGAGETARFSAGVKSSLFFWSNRTSGATGRDLSVFLRTEAPTAGKLPDWDVSTAMIEATLLDPDGKPVAPAPTSLRSGGWASCGGPGSAQNRAAYTLLSLAPITFADSTDNQYRLAVGDTGWLIPLASIGRYSLSVRVRRAPPAFSKEPGELLFDLPPAKIALSPTPP